MFGGFRGLGGRGLGGKGFGGIAMIMVSFPIQLPKPSTIFHVSPNP